MLVVVQYYQKIVMHKVVLLLCSVVFGLFFNAVVVAADSRPQRIVSLNLCTDQWLLALADSEQIASLTHLSHEVGASYLLIQALRYPTNKGRAEDILAFKPDLVLSSAYTNPATLNLLRQLHIRVETLPIAETWNLTFANLQQVADWIGYPERGQQMVKAMQQRLAHLPPAPTIKPAMAVYEPNGYTVGAEVLLGQMLSQAGWQNSAEQASITHYGQLSLEQLIHLRPQALITSPYRAGTWSRAEALLQHRVLSQVGWKPHLVPIPSAMLICAGPWSVDVVERLVLARLALEANQP